MTQCNGVFMTYDKEHGTIRVWSQGYDSSVFNAKDFFRCVEMVKKEGDKP